MLKFSIFLLILLGAAFYFPQTRPVMVETFAPVMNPVLTWQTRGEMDRIGRELETLVLQGGDIPTPGESFQNWMSKTFLGGAKTDAWGEVYRMKVWRDSVGLASSGPDGVMETADDIILSAVRRRVNRAP